MSDHRSTPGVAPGQGRLARRSKYPLQQALQARLAQIARRLRSSVPFLDPRDDQFLRDLDRKEPRYPMTALIRLTGLTARSEHRHHRDDLPQLMRELVNAQAPLDVLHPDAAFDGETDAQAGFDKAQRAYDHARTAESHARAIEAGKSQLTWTQACLDSLYANQPTQ